MCFIEWNVYVLCKTNKEDTDRRMVSGNPVTYSKAFWGVNRWGQL